MFALFEKMTCLIIYKTRECFKEIYGQLKTFLSTDFTKHRCLLFS